MLVYWRICGYACLVFLVCTLTAMVAVSIGQEISRAAQRKSNVETKRIAEHELLHCKRILNIVGTILGLSLIVFWLFVRRVYS
jgi:hypothetical protein